MFPLKILRDQPVIKFDRHLPIFNWHYPFSSERHWIADRMAPFRALQSIPVRRRAIYIHIPFCETICNFCPFKHDLYRPDDGIGAYLRALVREIELKRELLGRLSADAIFIGGGTPSVLTPAEIEMLGRAIAEHFDMRALREFTFEIEVKSISREKVEMMRAIGVNRVSFGAQTFSHRYRELFALDASQRQIKAAAEMLIDRFPRTNVDLLYGMAGQELDELDADLAAAAGLGTTTVDVYPLNNLTAPRRMHASLERAGLTPLPESKRLEFRMHLHRRFGELGYRPVNGYGFSAAADGHDPADPVQHWPKFLYHDLIYGHGDDAIFGYGASAISQFPGFNVHNFSSLTKYVTELQNTREMPHQVFRLPVAPERGLVTFPFRGSLDKSRVDWDRIPDQTWYALEDALEAELIRDRGDDYVLTQLGWLFYVNLMYYLMPDAGKQWISGVIESRSADRPTGVTSLVDSCSHGTSSELIPTTALVN